MNTFCGWLYETVTICVYDSFFRNVISIVLLSHCFGQRIGAPVHIVVWRPVFMQNVCNGSIFI